MRNVIGYRVNEGNKRYLRFHCFVMRVLLVCLAVGLSVMSLPMGVRAEGTAVSYLYHEHVGSREMKGGCYGQPVYHAHEGNESKGGKCYQDVIYHSHTGSAQTGGGCYLIPVYHVHSGDEEAGGGCYQEVYHEHAGSCYQNKSCNVTLSSLVYCFRTYEDTCFHHGVTIHGEWDAVLGHSDCGQGLVDTTVTICNSCRHYGTQHNYKKVVCDRGKEVEGYYLGCGKDDTFVDEYLMGCNKAAGEDIDGYGLSCKRTNQDIDGYEINCGKTPEVPYGYVKITNKTKGNAEKVTLEASWEDGTKGELIAKEIPFLWKDGTASHQIVVKKNGKYTVELQLVNEDIKKKSLSVTIAVSNIKEQAEDKPTDPNEGGGGTGNGGTDPGWDIPEVPGEKVEPKVTPVPVIQEITPTSVISQKKDVTRKEKEIAKGNLRDASTLAELHKNNKEEIETEIVELEERQAAGQEMVSVKKASLIRSLIEAPVAKVITLTLGGVLLLIGIIWLAVFFWKCVWVYCDNGEGKDCFMGFALIGKGCGHLILNMPSFIMERAYTNSYCLKPNSIFVRNHMQEELIVSMEDRKISLFIDNEIRFYAK